MDAITGFFCPLFFPIRWRNPERRFLQKIKITIVEFQHSAIFQIDLFDRKFLYCFSFLARCVYAEEKFR